jgi:small subunit ribosomal protein S17
VNTLAEKKETARNIGVPVEPPKTSCTDDDCPFHGTLPIRGQILTGVVISTKMQDSISVEREFMRFVRKYERYEKKTSTYHAHCPPCIKVKAGDKVRIAECRPLSKTVSFVTIEKM